MASDGFAAAVATELELVRERLLAQHARALDEALRQHEPPELKQLRAESAELRAESARLQRELLSLTDEVRSDVRAMGESVKEQCLSAKRLSEDVAARVREELAKELALASKGAAELRRAERAESDEKRKAEEEQRKQEEEEKQAAEKRQAEEQRKQEAERAEERRRAEEEVAAEVEARRRAEEVEAKRRAEEAERRQKTEAAEAERRAAEEKARMEAERRAAEEEEARKEAARRELEECTREEAERKAAEAAAAGSRDPQPAQAKSQAMPLNAALDLAAKMVPGMPDQSHGGGQLWIVVGGGDTGGILVRQSKSVQSPGYQTRLTTGTKVEEVEVHGKRLHYKRIRGDGPDFGWVSIEGVGGKKLMEPLPEEDPRR
uniref:Uncharacterized protein n=1 Tax=Alexandrium monilatum TaxID=311494 RepID=A0A7S4PUJ8_9DINO